MEVLSRTPNIWFTSDNHYGHPRILTLGRGRPFGSPRLKIAVAELDEALHNQEDGKKIELLSRERDSLLLPAIEEMNEAMIDRHNAVVKPGDLVYNLGDFALKITQQQAINIRRRLAGNIYFFEGNHDSIATSMPGQWVWVKQLARIHPKIEGIPPITLCHYAMRVWHGSHKGTWHLYGHSHGNLPEDHTLAFDVGVDCWDYTPISIEQVAEKMRAKMPTWEAYKEKLKNTGRAE